MSSVNKAIIVGRLGGAPKLSETNGGSAVANMSVATSEQWKMRDGTTQTRTEWHRVVVFGNQAKACAKYLDKGSLVYVEGSIETREWEARDGEKKTTTEIKARQITFLDSRGGSGGGDAGDITF